MKLHSFFAETALFLAACAVFVIPPLSASGADYEAFLSLRALLSQFLHCAAALLCLSAFRRIQIDGGGTGRMCRPAVCDFGDALVAFGGLCVCSAVMNIFAIFGGFSGGISGIEGLVPKSKAEFLLCMAIFFLAAQTEEAVYRAFLPEALSDLLFRLPALIFKSHDAKSSSKKYSVRAAVLILSDVASAALFAAAHRYLGAPAVINAAAAHFLLRRCFLRADRLAPGILAHFCYNAGSLMILRFLS